MHALVGCLRCRLAASAHLRPLKLHAALMATHATHTQHAAQRRHAAGAISSHVRLPNPAQLWLWELSGGTSAQVT